MVLYIRPSTCVNTTQLLIIAFCLRKPPGGFRDSVVPERLRIIAVFQNILQLCLLFILPLVTPQHSVQGIVIIQCFHPSLIIAENKTDHSVILLLPVYLRARARRARALCFTYRWGQRPKFVQYVAFADVNGKRFYTKLIENFWSRADLTFINNLTFADKNQAQVRQWNEVAARPNPAMLEKWG